MKNIFLENSCIEWSNRLAPDLFLFSKILNMRKKQVASALFSICFGNCRLWHMLYSINWPNFIVWLALILDYVGNMYIFIICFQVYNAIHFDIQAVFLNAQKVQGINLNILRWNKKQFPHFSRIFSWQKLSQNWELTFFYINGCCFSNNERLLNDER